MTNNNPFSQPPQSKHDYDAAGGSTANARVEINTGGGGRFSLLPDGTLGVQRNDSASVTVPVIEENIVSVNGATMTRQQYEYLVQSGGLPPNSKVHDPAPHKSEEKLRPFGEGGEADSLAAETDTPDLPAADTSTEAVFSRGQTALDTARATIGAQAVESAVQSAIVSGEFVPPPGTSHTQVADVVAAYTASAQEMIADAGISIGDMGLVLEDGDLRDARVATVSGNVDALRGVAAKAVDKLASLPVKDPDFFAFYLDRKFPDLDWKMEQGRALISVEGKGYVPWDTIVRMGWLSKAKQVRSRESGQ